MAEGRRYDLSAQLDIEQILLEAQNRWLRPPEICEILRNYQKFHIAPEPPNRPPSGSLFLFDRKVLRYFRKDGHNWRKKKDGKTVKEAHERLKAGSVDVLHCYYAHGEENENFQRRSYWMLEEDLMHIVLVHYREVKRNKVNCSRTRDSEDTSRNAHAGSPANSSFLMDNSQFSSRTMDTSSLNSTHTSEFDDAESDNHQVSSRNCFLDLQQSEDKSMMNNQMNTGLSNSYIPVSYQSGQSGYQGKQLNIPRSNFMLSQDNAPIEVGDSGFGLTLHGLRKQNGMALWEQALDNAGMHYQSSSFMLPVSSDQPSNIIGISEPENAIAGQPYAEDHTVKQELANTPQGQFQWQIAPGDNTSDISTWPLNEKLHIDSSTDLITSFQEREEHYVGVDSDADIFSPDSDQEDGSVVQNEFQFNLSNAEVGGLLTSHLDADNDLLADKSLRYSSCKRHIFLDNSTSGEEGIKKFDSFSRWMSKEFEEVDGPDIQSSSGIYWNPVDSSNIVEDSDISSHDHLDPYVLSPSVSQDQLFSILDFSPNWAYAGAETKVLITGSFLKETNDARKCKWSCMFGEVEVPADVLADGVLRCLAPVHAAGRVPFYVTSSNRVACSEVREFDFRVSHKSDMDGRVASDVNTNEMLLSIRFGKLLSLDSARHLNSLSSNFGEKSHICSKISCLLKEIDDDWSQIEKLMNKSTVNGDFYPSKVKEMLLEKILKEQLHAWLIHKVSEEGKGPNVLDKEGQGVLHLAAALGYDWAIAPTIAAGVNINFRDVHGWTALHWAAFCGRENTVIALVSLGGNTGALTDPTPKFPTGSTPADLASRNGHKGIAGYLAESSLTSHLQSLTIDKSRDGNASEAPGASAVLTVAEQSHTQLIDGDVDGLSLKDSLSAVRNAAQAAARIHEVFRVHSFHRKQLIEYGNDKSGMSDEQALSFVAVKSNRTGHDEPIHTAAIRIQNKFRSWKGRKEFLIIRQRIVKIQAHVRGHQVRKHFRKIVWSVGIVEKAILRWRRKGSGLRGFRSDGLLEGSTMQKAEAKEDDYDFLKEGRKQTEARLQKALARVRSMVQYPEARDQYRRLRHGVAEFQETKVLLEKLINDSEEAMDGDHMIDVEALLGDDTYMFTVS